jgi:DNA-binding response OmpR family regulator
VKVDLGRGEAEAPVHVPLRVLIVEDSEEDCLLVLRELERGGYEPFHERVDTPEEMWRALAERGPWDVVLSDWRMPRFSGIGALEMAREAESEAPFIIVSGKVGEEAAVEAMKTGAHDYVMKVCHRRAGARRGTGSPRARAGGEEPPRERGALSTAGRALSRYDNRSRPRRGALR